MSKLPQECGTILTAVGFEPPVPADADRMPEPRLWPAKKVVPPPPKLDPATGQALLASSSKVPLPERNPNR